MMHRMLQSTQGLLLERLAFQGFEDLFNLEEEGRAEQVVEELEGLDMSADEVEASGVSDDVPAVPRMLPIPTQVCIRIEDRFNRHVYEAFIVCGANKRVVACLSREAVTMKGITELANGDEKNVEKWISGVAKLLNTGKCTVITPVLLHLGEIVSGRRIIISAS